MEADLLRPISLELRHLRLVYAIQELGSLTRAGERLNVTQSALSHQLREIEDRLSVQLFLRVGKKLVATEAGQRLGEMAREILAGVIEAEEDLLDRAHDRRGTIRVTTSCYTCYHWLPPLLRRFERVYPDVKVHIVAEATGRAVEALTEGTVDLALTSWPQNRDDLRARHLFDDELLLVTAPDHPLTKKAFVVPQDLAGERLLLYTQPASSHFYSHFFGGANVKPREIVQMQLTEAMVSMIHAGLAVGALARWAIQNELRRGTLATVQLGRKGMRRQWQAVTRHDRRTPRYLDDFIDLIIDEAAPKLQRAG
jgi:LysR family transcriptional regulator, regulator for metE and metH